MNEQEIMRELHKPFPSKDIRWRVSRAMNTRNGKKAVVLAYVDNRAIQERLDRLFGVSGWKPEFHQWRDKGTLCRLSVKIGGEWVTKEDGSDETNFEATKGGFSGAMKRAAVQFGIGRYLYDLPETFVDVTDKRTNTSVYIKDKKAGVEGHWEPPRLPGWALPEEEQGKQPQQPNGKQYGQSGPQRQQNGRQQGGNQQQEQKVTESQLKAMHAAMKEIADLAGGNTDVDVVKDTLKANFQYEGSCRDLTEQQARAMMNKLNEWRNQYQQRSA